MYTVGEMARMLHVPASTLRYYDKQGLLPFVERSPGGIRVFKDSDFEWLRIIECMKKAGMSLKDIRIYIELAMQGDSTIDARLAMFRRQQDTLRAQMQQLQDTMQVLEYKCWYYETAQKLGSIDAVKNLPDKDIPAEMQAVKAKAEQLWPFLYARSNYSFSTTSLVSRAIISSSLVSMIRVRTRAPQAVTSTTSFFCL